MEARSQPSGTVSFLFSDVEGSTGLLQRLGAERYGEVLARHRELLRAAFAAEQGYEVDCEGDSFFVAFPTPGQAVSAASRAQQALAAERWSDGEEVWVRMGVHTGEPMLAPPKYVGLDVHKAARVMQAGHGGQVLVSQETRELLDESFRLRDLGEHRLKDLEAPTRLYQLEVEGLPSEFPALKTLENRPMNLPVQSTPLIGRDREVAAVTERLRRDGVRLLTLTGPGGTGKTRLALQAAADLIEDFPQGVYFVALASIADPELALPTIAQTLGVRESAGVPLGESVQRYLADKRLLLIVDNLEHVTEAAPVLSELLAAAPQVKLLVTSRTPAHLSGEHEFPVPPLELPDPAHLPEPGSLSQYEAVALFIERARAVKPDFAVTSENAPAVAEICVRLDGLPLAIELAAARTRLLSPQALLSRLEESLDLLTAGPRDQPARHQTLRATIDWSYQLLGPDAQTLFARLAVFHGGCTLDAAEALCGGGDVLAGLATLVDDNLLRQEEQPDGEPRFTMLETIRAYALERLEANGEADEIGHRHAEWFSRVDERMRVDWRVGDVDWLRLERDLDNFRAALRVLAGRDRESFIRLVCNLRWFCQFVGYLREGTAWSEQATRLAADLPTGFQARAWQCEASFAFTNHEFERATDLFRRVLDASRGDGRDESFERAWVVRSLSALADVQGDLEEADSLSEQAETMFRELGNAHGMLVAALDRARFSLRRGDYGRARALLDESVARARDLDDDFYLANALADLGVLELREHHYPEAVAVFAAGLERFVKRGIRVGVGISLRGLAATAAAAGQLEAAARMLGSADRIDDETGFLWDTFERDTFTEAIAPVFERANEPGIAAAMAAGRTMSEADAVAYALAWVADRPPRKTLARKAPRH
jgi:predicted ATPase/class 3 adenylate cyclase